MARTSAEAPPGLRRERGELVGIDPRQMTKAALEGLGHASMPATKAIRHKCLDCCCGSSHEVGLCTATKCSLWPWRLGNHPWHGKGKGGDG
jgi:hypothetical protein